MVHTDAAEPRDGTESSASGTIWICAGTDVTRRALSTAAEAEDVRYLIVQDEDDLGRRLADSTPAALLVEHEPPRFYATDVLELLRAAPKPEGSDHEIRLVLIAQPEVTPDLRDIGVAEVLELPLGEAFLRAHMKGWSTRTPVRWQRGATPESELDRLDALRGLGLLDSPPEERFDRITRIARGALDVPIVLVSLIDDARQWFKSCQGLDVSETHRDAAFCAHAVTNGTELIVTDASADDRFADNPLVTGGPRIRFYAGMPLCLESGLCIGTLCVIDFHPRTLTEPELDLLRDLRDLVLREVHLEPEAGLS